MDMVPATIRPPRAGVYPVRVLIRDPMTQEPRGTVLRFARWSGAWWCCWATDAQRAAACRWRGPADGYAWYGAAGASIDRDDQPAEAPLCSA